MMMTAGSPIERVFTGVPERERDCWNPDGCGDGALRRSVGELYDHDSDPLETRNIADTPAGIRVIADLRSRFGGAAR